MTTRTKSPRKIGRLGLALLLSDVELEIRAAVRVANHLPRTERRRAVNVRIAAERKRWIRALNRYRVQVCENVRFGADL